ncbi:MAG: crotonase/enoyl-CoA hydratase family protein [Chloroflexota bacterium]
MAEGKITIEKKGHLMFIGIDRVAKLNSFTPQMYSDLSIAFREYDDDSEMRCAVIFGHGDHFTSGLDLPQWVDVMANGDRNQLQGKGLDPFGLDASRRTKKPLVIAVQGYCYTLGLELLLACDIRIAADNTRFAMLEVKRGIFPTGGGTIRLPLVMGWGNAMRYLLTGDEFNGDEAYRYGVVQAVTKPGDQLAKAIEFAEKVAAQAPLAVQTVLKSSRMMELEGVETAVSQLYPLQRHLLQTEDVQEGVRAFIERRPAQFKGK